MRGRSPLVLMEQVIMLAVFALAAALCLRVFVLSDQLSRQGEIRDQALLQAQSAAEVYRHCQGQGDQAVELAGGSWDGASWTLLWDESWQLVDQADQAEYRLTVTPEDSGNELLGRAQVTVTQAGETEPVCTLPLAWQEVTDHG